MDWITFTLDGTPYPAIAAHFDAGLSSMPRAVVHYVVDVDAPPPAISTAATVTLADGHASELSLAGELTAWQWTDQYTESHRAIVVATIEPPLARLALGRDARVFQGLAINELVGGLLKENGLTAHDFRFDLDRAYDSRPYTVQWSESDLDFLQRLLARDGIGWRIERVSEGEKPARDVVVFFDSNRYFRRALHGAVAVTPETGTPRSLPCFSAFGECARRTPLSASVHDYQPDTPELALHVAAGNARTINTPLSPRLYGAAAGGGEPGHMSDAERRARLEVERYRVRARDYVAHGNLALAPGETFTLMDPGFGGDYAIVSVSARAEQPAPGAIGDAGQSGFRATYRLLPAETIFRPHLIEPPKLPFLFSARIETEGDYALLDEQGRYVMRSLFDVGDSENGRASPFFRKASAFAGPSVGGLATGLHLPLRQGCEVIWGALHGDPERPVILGTVPNMDQGSPVTTLNPYDNRLRTAAGNELLMRDLKDEETIHLKQGDADSPFNLFELCAAPEQERVRLHCQQGAIHFYAKQTTGVTAGDSVKHTVGSDRIETVENHSTLTTKNKDIHTQAATDHIETAKQNIKLQAGKNIELKTGEDCIVRADQNLRLETKDGNIIHVAQGSYRLQAAEGITIESLDGGKITLGSNGGYIIIEPGHIKITGNTIAFNGTTSLKGKVNYQVASPATAPKVEPLEALQPEVIPLLGVELRDVILHLDAPAGSEKAYRFILKDEHGRYYGEKTFSDDIDPSNDTLDLRFEGVPATSRYTLIAETDGEKVTLIENIPFAALAGASQNA